jgi:hypothetical protein
MSAEISYYGALFDTKDPVTPAIAKAANIAKTYGLALVKAKTPVDTGQLKDKWEAKFEANGIRWSNSMPYAGFVELGTKFMAPRSMLSSSLGDITQVFREELGREMGKRLAGQIIATPGDLSYDTRISDAQAKSGLKPAKFSKKYLFADPSKILSSKQISKLDSAKPLLRRGGLPY